MQRRCRRLRHRKLLRRAPTGAHQRRGRRRLRKVGFAGNVIARTPRRIPRTIPSPPLRLSDTRMAAETTAEKNEILERSAAAMTPASSPTSGTDCRRRAWTRDIIHFLSAKKDEPEWMTEWRPRLPPLADDAGAALGEVDRADRLQAIVFLGAPKAEVRLLDEVCRRNCIDTYEKLGVPMHERALPWPASRSTRCSFGQRRTTYPGNWPTGIDLLLDQRSRSASTRNWCKISRQRGADRRQLLRRAELGGVLRRQLRVHPRGVRCPMELPPISASTPEHRPVRAHPDHRRGRRLTSATSKAAPRRCATRTSCTRRWSNWSRWTTPRSNIRPCRTGTRRRERRRRHLQLRDQARRMPRRSHKVSWTQVETGSAITWKYPSCVLLGDDSVGEFHSVALTHHRQQADTGTKMIHVGKRTKSKIVARASAPGGQNTYRGLVRCSARPKARANFTQCDSLLIGGTAAPHLPYIEAKNSSASSSTRRRRRSATTSCSIAMQRGHLPRKTRWQLLIVDGFVKDVLPRTADGVRGGGHRCWISLG